MEENSTSYTENLIIVLIIAVALGTFGWFLRSANKKAIIAEQQMELRILTDAVTMYHIHNDSYPINPANFNRWCLVGNKYPYGTCLGELASSKYLRQLPIESKRTSYYYQILDDTAYIATPVDTQYSTIPAENTCYGNVGETMLCYTTDI
jgi:hypothetical protein